MIAGSKHTDGRADTGTVGDGAAMNGSKLICIAALLLMAPAVASARTETLRWTHSDPPNVAGFVIYYGLSSGDYTTDIDVPAPQSDAQGIFSFDIGVPDDATIYVALTAYDGDGVESYYSNEGTRSPASQEPTPTPTPAAQACADIALVLHYDFATDEGVVVSDLSPAEHDGTVQDATWEGGVYRFDGANDYIDAHSPPGLDNLSAFTYAAWIKPTALGDLEIISKAGSTHEIRIDGTRLRGCIRADPNSCAESVDDAIALDTWQHVAMTYDHGGDRKVHLYTEGAEVAYAAQPTAGGVMASDASSDLNIGRRSNSGDRYFAGLIDDVRIYDRALMAHEIAAPPDCDSATPTATPTAMPTATPAATPTPMLTPTAAPTPWPRPPDAVCADFTGHYSDGPDGVVGFADFGRFLQLYGTRNDGVKEIK
jgi:hypothetical protein